MSPLRTLVILLCTLASVAAVVSVSAEPATAGAHKAHASSAGHGVTSHAARKRARVKRSVKRRAKRALRRRGIRRAAIGCKRVHRSNRRWGCRFRSRRSKVCRGKVALRKKPSGRWATKVRSRCRAQSTRYFAIFGFNEDAAGQHRVSAQTEAGLAARAGATVERTPLAWSDVEAQPGQFDWSRYDALYAAYRSQGIRPVWAVQYAPPWARDGINCPSSMPNCVAPQSPAHDGDFRNFVAAVTRRYPESAAIEVWNEENAGLFWAGAPNPERYAQVLRAAYSGAKSANPSMPVVLGGLADVGRDGISAGTFLNRVYRAGGRGAMDAIGYHPYPSLPNPVRMLRVRMAGIRAARNQAGAGSTPIWVTETGASNASAPGYPGYSEGAQATALVQLYRELGTMPDVQAVILHRLIDPPGGGIESRFGAVRGNLSPKPAFCAVARVRGKPGC